jgi:hypothetical protein
MRRRGRGGGGGWIYKDLRGLWVSSLFVVVVDNNAIVAAFVVVRHCVQVVRRVEGFARAF